MVIPKSKANTNKKSKITTAANGKNSYVDAEKDIISSPLSIVDNTSKQQITSKSSVIGGGKPLKRGFCYSSDNKYFLQAFNNNTLKVFYIPTRQCVNTFQISMADDVNSDSKEANNNAHLSEIRIDPLVSNIVWIFNVSDNISIINWKNGKSWSLKNNGVCNLNSIVDFRFNFSLKSYEMIYICGKVSQKSTHKKYLKKLLIKVAHLQESIPSSMALNKPSDALFDYDSLSNSSEVIDLLPLGRVGQYAQSLNSKHLLVSTIDTNDNTSELKHIELKSFKIIPEHGNYTLKLSKKNKISTLAISNSGLCAVGYSSGIIEIMYNFIPSNSSNTDTKILRWHINAVTALAFTKDSSYLLSGGKENVLVFWQIEMEKHQFLPRLNGHITQIVISSLSVFEESPSSANLKASDSVTTSAVSPDADFYTLVLEIPDTVNNETEVLVLNSLELTSRLSICGMRIATNTPLSQFSKEERRLKKSTDTFHGIQNDYTSSAVSVIPNSQQLFLASGSELQCYNMLTDKPIYNINVAAKISYGKVKAELSLKEPQLIYYKMISTTSSTGGVISWLATIDKQEITVANSGSNTGSKISYTLKFWRKKSPAALGATTPNSNTKKTGESGEWELFTKIADPHGASVPVADLISAPASYFNGLAFLTVDYLGGLRIWRPIKKQTNDPAADSSHATIWSLRRIVAPILSNNSNVIDTEKFPLCCDWSDDSSLFVLSMKNSIYKLDMSNMSAEWEYLDKMSGVEGVVKWLKFSERDYHLYVMTDSSMNSDTQGDLLTVFNLINGTASQKLKLRNSNSNNGSENNGAASTLEGADSVTYSGNTKKSQLKYSSNLMNSWCDSQNNEYLAIALNYIFNDSKHIIMVFKNGQRLPSATVKGENYVITLQNTGKGSAGNKEFSGFIYLDSKYNVRHLVPQSASSTITELAYNGMNKRITSRGSSLRRSGLIQVHGGALSIKKKDADGDIAMDGQQEEHEEGFWYGKKINTSTFNDVLSNDLEGIDMVDLFNAIVECI